jgi:hypothetical protein
LSLKLYLWLSPGLCLRPHGLRLRRMTNHRRLGLLNLRRSRLALALNPRRFPSQLLIINRLLQDSFTLSLLLLPHDLSLVLDLRHWLADAFAPRLLIRHAFDLGLLHLLTAQLLHLLPCATITSGCLSGEVRHLSLARLLRGNIWRLRLSLLDRRRSFIPELQFLPFVSSGKGLHA